VTRERMTRNPRQARQRRGMVDRRKMILFPSDSMKTCKQCQVEKPYYGFYPGHNKCKECVCVRVRAHREKKLNDPTWVAKERERCRIKTAKARAEGRMKPTSVFVKQAWAKRNVFKRRAQAVAQRALVKGLIRKPDACEECGAIT